MWLVTTQKNNHHTLILSTSSKLTLIYQKISFIVQQKIICDSCKSTKITYNNIQQVNFPVSAGNLSSFIQNYFKEKIETCEVWRQ